ncbi:tumor necrosis factor receptor superfamily member 25 [Eublepharis macularius]|uniref:Tumor necrosis factor receptor superfamily member 25 n=1 Tax=Eublepharis macularius TaxID=481883 RepID=A0AA97LJL2_EUBMA|nr:tumor necrosis factor receptor superfamily member 25 [Eublepharis macularius]
MLLSAAGAVSSPKYKSEEAPEFPSSLSPSQVQRGLPRADPSPHHSLLQGRKLYAVIDAVPARRWKEFVRGLGLRDGEIESVEVEHRQLREQQYEMLKRWRQQQGATVDAIFAVLEDMQLGGCAHELREQLQPSNLLPSHL